MPHHIQLSEKIQKILCCPICQTNLKPYEENYQCQNPECSFSFPTKHGIPILINEVSSVFSIKDFINERDTFFNLSYTENPIKQQLRKLIPDISKNVKAKTNYKKYAELLLAQSEKPIVLVIGGSILGEGMESITSHPSIELVESDISFGPRTHVICDAHNIPFKNNSFDGVIVQAVLEHVIDPWQCVEEIHRVIKEGGLVYAETPFIQQVHGGCYDFTRFTYLGHRRLFRSFVEIESGAACGPGMALAWSYQYFFLSFALPKLVKSIVVTFAKLTSFYLKYIDYLIINNPKALDAASAVYFMGRKQQGFVLSDKELIKLYKGNFR